MRSLRALFQCDVATETLRGERVHVCKQREDMVCAKNVQEMHRRTTEKKETVMNSCSEMRTEGTSWFHLFIVGMPSRLRHLHGRHVTRAAINGSQKVAIKGSMTV